MNSVLPLVGETYLIDNGNTYHNTDTGKVCKQRDEFLVLAVIPRTVVNIYIVGLWAEAIKPSIMTLDEFNMSRPIIQG